MWFGTALSKMVRLKFEITLHGAVNETPHTHIHCPLLRIIEQPHVMHVSASIQHVRMSCQETVQLYQAQSSSL